MEGRGSDHLSRRELEVLQLAAEGLTDKGIAARLGISHSTVETYWLRLRSKVGAHSRTELIARVLTDRFRATLDTIRASAQTEVLGMPEDGDWARIVEHLPDAVLIVRPDGFIAYGNALAREMFDHGGLAGASVHLSELVPARFRKEHDRSCSTYFESPIPQEMADHEGTLAIGADGSEFKIAANLAAVETKAGMRAVCVVRRV